MAIGAILGKVLSSSAGEVIKNVGGVIDNLTTSKEEKEAAKLALQQEINRNFEVLEKNSKEIYEAELKDRQSARELQMTAIGSKDWFTRNYLYVLASAIIGAAITFGVILCFFKIPEENKRLVEMFCDIFLFAGAMMVLQFFFGSSKGSRDNAEVVRKMVKQNQ